MWLTDLHHTESKTEQQNQTETNAKQGTYLTYLLCTVQSMQLILKKKKKKEKETSKTPTPYMSPIPDQPNR